MYVLREITNDRTINAAGGPARPFGSPHVEDAELQSLTWLSPTLVPREQMTNERRYQDDEVKEILGLAANRAELGRPAVSDEGGLTLSELQEVGLEVGMDPARIAEAAFAVDTRRQVLPRRTSLGMPVSVSRVIELPRAVTDREWELLVAELRETFGARGQVASHGGVREWTNGNLHAFLEPTETGHRLRLRTHKGGAMALNRMGVTGLAMGLILLTMFLTTGLSPVRLELVMMSLVAIGGGALASNVLSLPRWAREREGQMEYLAGRVGALLGEPPQGEKSGT